MTTSIADELDLDFPQCLAADFAETGQAVATVEALIARSAGSDYRALDTRSPGLEGFDWPNYLRCSVARMVHASAALRRRGVTAGRVLDFGAYFGNFSLFFQRLGYAVDAVDAFAAYAPALDGSQALLREAGVRVLDFEAVGRELEQMPAGTYDVVLCTGVIEHIPHTPRPLLEALTRVLRVGGQLVLDTPNLAHIYNRQKLARGESVAADLATQYPAVPPFEGHHREYTMAELVWMLQQLGHRDIVVEAFNYSMYGQGTLRGRDVTNHWAMVRDPTMREYLMTVSTKPTAGAPAPAVAWTSALYDPEQYWQRRLPALPPPVVSAEGEQMLVVLQHEVDHRDTLLKDVQGALQRELQTHEMLQNEINRRDGLLNDMQAALQGEIKHRDAMIDGLRAELADLTRGWRRWVIGRRRN